MTEIPSIPFTPATFKPMKQFFLILILSVSTLFAQDAKTIMNLLNNSEGFVLINSITVDGKEVTASKAQVSISHWLETDSGYVATMFSIDMVGEIFISKTGEVFFERVKYHYNKGIGAFVFNATEHVQSVMRFYRK